MKKKTVNILNNYIEITKQNAKNMKVALVASILNETRKFSDFKYNSVTTSYLSKEQCNFIINSLRENNIYVELYNDVENFFEDYYKSKFNCNIIFETSPKGIARGKDCLLPSFCDTIELNHIGPDASSNYKCINKYNWYCILAQNNIPVPSTFLYNKKWINNPIVNDKYILKLCEECASIGLGSSSVINNNIDLLTDKASILNKQYNEPIIAQKFISGYEVEVPILVNNKERIILPAIGLSYSNKQYLENEFFNYEQISDDFYGVYLFEEKEPELAKKIYEIVDRVIDVLCINGYFRIDFRVSKTDGPYVIDINNDPTLSDEGSFQYSIKSLGFDSKDTILIIIGNYLFNKSNIECH